MATYVRSVPLRRRYNRKVGTLDYPGGAPGTFIVPLGSGTGCSVRW